MTVHFIGAGPGAPDLITVRGLRLIRSCHNIFQLVKLGGFAMVSRRMLVVFGGALVEIAQQ